MEINTNNYFLNIPNELKVKIACYLNTIDLIELCNAYPDFEEMLSERSVIRKINFSKEYSRVTIKHLRLFSTIKLRAELITWLNISCIYWIPAANINRCLVKMINLECLYAMDTKLSISENDTYCKTLEKLHTLAITVTDNSFCVPWVKSFVLKRFYIQMCFHTLESIQSFKQIILSMNGLDELWAIDMHGNAEILLHVSIYGLHIQKLGILLDGAQQIIVGRNFPGRKLFQNTQGGWQVIIEMTTNNRMDIYDFPSQISGDTNWDILLNRLKCDLPFGFDDAKRFNTKNCPIKDVMFEELNFDHAHCCKLLVDTLRNVLTGSNMKFLRKLCTNYCLASQTHNKRKRSDNAEIDPKTTTLEEVVKNSPFIEELEFWKCSASYPLDNDSFLPLFSLRHLKRLTLDEIPIHLNCMFLIDLLETCKELESLRICSTSQNSPLNNSICLALPNTNSLRDFRLEHTYLPIDRLMESLTDIRRSKLERLFIKCSQIENFKAASFDNFLLKNPQLRFVCIVLKEVPKTAIRNISKILNKYKTGPEKVFYATQNESIYSGRMPIPYIHKIEMIRCRSKVCPLDIFDGCIRC